MTADWKQRQSNDTGIRHLEDGYKYIMIGLAVFSDYPAERRRQSEAFERERYQRKCEEESRRMAAVMGLVLGGLWIATGNLLVPIATHAVYDFLGLIWLVKWERPRNGSINS